MAFSYLLRVDNPTDLSEATEALEPLVVDTTTQRLQQWADQARQESGADALRDLDSVPNLLDLTGAHPAGIAQLYGGRQTRLSSLLRDQSAFGFAVRATASLLESEKQASLARYGLYPTYLVVGVAAWTQLPPFKEEDRGTQPDFSYFKLQNFNIPVLLRPLEFESLDEDFVLRMDGAALLNPILVQAFTQRGIDFDAEELMERHFGAGGFGVSAFLQELRTVGQDYIPGFDLRENVLVGNLGLSGALLTADWDRILPQATHNPLARAFAGDPEASEALMAPLPLTSSSDRDPDEERGIGDLDVTQSAVVEVVAAGRSVFVEVPPGAPGTETVAALLADAAASGRQLCYVPGVRRIGVNVTSMLRKSGMEAFVLDLTGSGEWRASLRSQLADLNQEPPQVQAPVAESELGRAHQLLRETRQKLWDYSQRLHQVRQPWEVSAYEALQALADLTSAKPGPRTKVRLNLADSERSAKEGREEARKLLLRAQESGLLRPELQDSPWNGVVLSTQADAKDVIDRVNDLAGDKLSDLYKAIEVASEQTGLVMPQTLAAWEEQLGMLQGVAKSLEVFKPEIFEKSAADLVIATASPQWRAARSLPMKLKERRALVRQAKEALRPGISVRDLHAELVRIQSYRDLWRRYALPGAWPRIPDNLMALKTLTGQVLAQLEALEAVLSEALEPRGTKYHEAPLSGLVATVKALHQSQEDALALPQQVGLWRELKAAGLQPLLDDLRSRQVDPDLALAELDLAWWSAIITAIMQSDPVLAGTDGEALHELADKMRSLDLAQVASLTYPVMKAISRVSQSAKQEYAALLDQLVESLLSSAAIDWPAYLPLLHRLRPVWALSPFVVSQLYGEHEIDLLILDHLDHLSLPQVMPLVARAKQLVVLGDSRRGWTGFTQVAAKVLPRLELRCELGQLNEQVAEFLSKHGYAETVWAVPSPRPASLVGFHQINGSEAPLARDQSLVISRAEIQRVISLCLDHALNKPLESLAVVCINPEAVARIRSAIKDALIKVPQAQPFFHKSGPEPFVVVDSAGTAGLRRDVVILSLGMSKTPQGRVQLNFGPVSGASGVAHLVGSLEVARQRLEIVSSFTAAEVDATKVTNPGGKMLLDLLEAANNPDGMQRALTSEESFASEPDRLLVDLAQRLWHRGLTVVPRFGLTDGIQIPLAIGHAELPSELLVAVLTDGESYVSQPSARRRERYWPARLEAAGWRVVTCYTTEVFADPQFQADCVEAAVEDALRQRLQARSVPVIAAPEVELRDDVTLESQAPQSPDSKPLPTAKSPNPPDADSAHPNSDTAADLAATALDREGVSGGTAPDSAADVKAQPSEGSSRPHLQLVARERGPRPPIAKGLPLAAYGDDQLDELLEWICSDGVMREEDQLVEELRETLALSRRGAQVDAVLRHVVRRRAQALG